MSGTVRVVPAGIYQSVENACGSVWRSEVTDDSNTEIVYGRSAVDNGSGVGCDGEAHVGELDGHVPREVRGGRVPVGGSPAIPRLPSRRVQLIRPVRGGQSAVSSGVQSRSPMRWCGWSRQVRMS